MQKSHQYQGADVSQYSRTPHAAAPPLEKQVATHRPDYYEGRVFPEASSVYEGDGDCVCRMFISAGGALTVFVMGSDYNSQYG